MVMVKARESMSAPPIASWQERRHCDDTLMTPMLSLLWLESAGQGGSRWPRELDARMDFSVAFEQKTRLKRLSVDYFRF